MGPISIPTVVIIAIGGVTVGTMHGLELGAKVGILDIEGPTVGTEVGVAVEIDGLKLILDEGVLEIMILGFRVGILDGVKLICIEGRLVGEMDGFKPSSSEGMLVGSNDGIIVGSNDEIVVGNNDCCNVTEGPLLACRDGLFEGWLLAEGAGVTDGWMDEIMVVGGIQETVGELEGIIVEGGKT
jgi:hypothetical protein